MVRFCECMGGNSYSKLKAYYGGIIMEFDEEVLETFIEKQTQLFSEVVAETPEAAEEFLEDCMAVVCKNIKEVREYFEDAGTDIAGMSEEELLDQSEVFSLPSGRFLIVEG